MDGSFNHTRCFIRDDTARKVNEARAEAREKTYRDVMKQKDQFVQKTFHEVRTPCHMISMALENLRCYLPKVLPSLISGPQFAHDP